MRTRLLSGMVLGSAFLLITWYGHWPFLVVAAGGVVLALHEFYGLARRGGARPLEVAGYLTGALTVTSVGLSWPSPMIGTLIAGCASATLAALLPHLSGPTGARNVLTDWGATWAGITYLVPPTVLLVVLRAAPHGLGWLILVFAITWSCDSAAYFGGRAFGRRPFFPTISPKKTREGAIAGLLGGAVAALAVVQTAHLPVQSLVALIMGLTVAAAAEAGDLVESLLKRQTGVKDSGTLIPGHGGLLDRIDSLLFAVVVTFYWYLLVT